MLGFLTRRRLRKDAQAALVVQRRWRRLCRRRAALRAEREQLEKAQSQAASVIQVEHPGLWNLGSFSNF